MKENSLHKEADRPYGPPVLSARDLRKVYRGKTAVDGIVFLDESFQAGLGGKGGMEFFVNHLTASFIEFGGIAPLYSSNPSHKMQSFSSSSATGKNTRLAFI